MQSVRARSASFSRGTGFSAALVALISCFSSGAVFALTTLNVTINSDNNPGGLGELGDLRNALNAMNQGLNATPDDYAIAFANPMTIQLNGILPIVNNSSNPVNITIGNASAASVVTIDGNNGTYSGLFIPTGNVAIQNMVFQNMTARGGNGGNGISGGGGGMGAGGAIYAPQTFLNGSNPSITLLNVSISNCAAVGGNGGSYLGVSSSGYEGGGGGGGFAGNGGSILTTGDTGGAGGGGFGGDGGGVTLSSDNPLGGGGAGGGGLGSRATVGTLSNLGNGGSDQNAGLDGSGYGLVITAGAGGGGYSGGSRAGGGGGGNAGQPSSLPGGGGGGSDGLAGSPGLGSIAPGVRPIIQGVGAAPRRTGIPRDGAVPSAGPGGDGGGGGGGGIVITNFTNDIDGAAAGGGYGGGGGGGAGPGAYDIGYTVQGGSGGVGGGGGGGGVNLSGTIASEGGNSLGGGGGAGGGPSNGSTAVGGTDIGNLGGGSGGVGGTAFKSGVGGGGGGGGSGLGGAIFVDSNLNFTLQALAGVPTTFSTSGNSTQAGTHGAGAPGASDGFDGSALGSDIFLRNGSSLTLLAPGASDLLTLGAQVTFTDDTLFGAGGTNVFVKGNGTVAYNGTTDYPGTISITNANLSVSGKIEEAAIFVDGDTPFSTQKGTLSGAGTLTGAVYVRTGTIYPDAGKTLTLGSVIFDSAYPGAVHITINPSGASSVAVNGAATLSGTLEIDLDPATSAPATYTILSSSGISDSFGSVAFTAATPAAYSLAYLPSGNPTSVQLTVLSAQAITNFTATPANPAFTLGGTFTVAATGDASGNPVTFSIASGSAGICMSGGTNGATITMLAAGTCTVLADQAGNANYIAAAEAMLNVGVGVANQTIVNFTATPSSPTYTLNGTFTVSATGGASGNPVTFSIAAGSASVCSSGGTNGATITTLGAGSCAVLADQAGDANYAAATELNTSVTIGKDTTSTTLAVTPNPASFGQTVTLTATVSGDPPSGTITFFDGAATLGTGTLTQTSATSSVATFSTSTLSAGTHQLSASFAGDANNIESASTRVAVTVAANPPPVPVPTFDRWVQILLCGMMIAAVASRVRVRS